MQEGQYKELQQKEQSLKQQMRELQASIGENQGQMSEKIRRHENLSGANEQRLLQLEEMLCRDTCQMRRLVRRYRSS